jgi:hypothetical protein
MPIFEFVGRIANPSHAGTRINRLVGQTPERNGNLVWIRYCPNH